MTNTMNITREYTHRTHGPIGKADLSYEAIETDDNTLSVEWMLNGVVLPEYGVRHLLTFALQTLQDAYAGSDNPADAIAAFETKLKRIQSGEIGKREAGTGVDRLTALRRIVAREVAKKTMDKTEYKRDFGSAVVAAELHARLDAMADADTQRGAFIRKTADKRHEDEKREAAEMAELAALMADSDS